MLPTPTLSQQSQSLSSELEQSIENGTPVWLTADERFLAIFTPNQIGDTVGGAILLHDSGRHPQWPAVIGPLRNHLPLNGWSTHAIHMESLSDANSVIEDQARLHAQINAAVEDLRSRGIANIVIIGHGTGAALGAHYVAQTPEHGIRGLVVISLTSAEQIDPALDSLNLVEGISIPLFDIYGSNDLFSVTDKAARRGLAARKAGSKTKLVANQSTQVRPDIALTPVKKTQGFIMYRQVEVLGADHEFIGHQTQLNRRILGWLNRHAKGVAVKSAAN